MRKSTAPPLASHLSAAERGLALLRKELATDSGLVSDAPSPAPDATSQPEPEAEPPDEEIEETDVTDLLSDEEIGALFAAMTDDDFDQVDRWLDEAERRALQEEIDSGALQIKEGGADRNRGGAEKLRRYWTIGEGGAKIRWGTGGDFTRCVKYLSKYLGPRAKGYCALRHKEMNGVWPGDKANTGKTTPRTTQRKDAPMQMEHKVVPVVGQKIIDQAQGIVETIVSVTGHVDEVNDDIRPGAYAKTLRVRNPKGVWGHDWMTPVSKTLAVEELLPGDPRLPTKQRNGEPWPEGAGGLLVKTQFNLGTQRGREAYSDVTFFGEEQEWSIGYQVPVGGAKVNSKTGVREIHTIDLYEYSPVLFGAMPLAQTMAGVKAAQAALAATRKVRRPSPADLAARLAKRGSQQQQAKDVWTTLEGSAEDVLRDVRHALSAQYETSGGDTVGYDDSIWVEVQATFSDRVLYRLYGRGVDDDEYYEAPYSIENGTVVLGAPTRVRVVASVEPVDVAEPTALHAFGAVEKAYAACMEIKIGRVLSAANVAALESAIAGIQSVLDAHRSRLAPSEETVTPKGEKDLRPALAGEAKERDYVRDARGRFARIGAIVDLLEGSEEGETGEITAVNENGTVQVRTSSGASIDVDPSAIQKAEDQTGSAGPERAAQTDFMIDADADPDDPSSRRGNSAAMQQAREVGDGRVHSQDFDKPTGDQPLGMGAGSAAADDAAARPDLEREEGDPHGEDYKPSDPFTALIRDLVAAGHDEGELNNTTLADLRRLHAEASTGETGGRPALTPEQESVASRVTEEGPGALRPEEADSLPEPLRAHLERWGDAQMADEPVGPEYADEWESLLAGYDEPDAELAPDQSRAAGDGGTGASDDYDRMNRTQLMAALQAQDPAWDNDAFAAMDNDDMRAELRVGPDGSSGERGTPEAAASYVENIIGDLEDDHPARPAMTRAAESIADGDLDGALTSLSEAAAASDDSRLIEAIHEVQGDLDPDGERLAALKPDNSGGDLWRENDERAQSPDAPAPHPDTAAGAEANLAENADESVNTMLARETEAGGRWVPDPEVDGVWGFRGADGEILAVSYNRDADFELSEEGAGLLGDMPDAPDTSGLPAGTDPDATTSTNLRVEEGEDGWYVVDDEHGAFDGPLDSRERAEGVMGTYDEGTPSRLDPRTEDLLVAATSDAFGPDESDELRDAIIEGNWIRVGNLLNDLYDQASEDSLEDSGISRTQLLRAIEAVEATPEFTAAYGEPERDAVIMNADVDPATAMQRHDEATLRTMATDGNLREQERQAARAELARRASEGADADEPVEVDRSSASGAPGTIATIEQAQAALEAALADARADNPDANEDDVAHDMVQSVAYQITDPEVRHEFVRREGVVDPVDGWDPMADFDQPPSSDRPDGSSGGGERVTIPDPSSGAQQRRTYGTVEPGGIRLDVTGMSGEVVSREDRAGREMVRVRLDNGRVVDLDAREVASDQDDSGQSAGQADAVTLPATERLDWQSEVRSEVTRLDGALGDDADHRIDLQSALESVDETLAGGRLDEFEPAVREYLAEIARVLDEMDDPDADPSVLDELEAIQGYWEEVLRGLREKAARKPVSKGPRRFKRKSSLVRPRAKVSLDRSEIRAIRQYKSVL